MKINFICPKMGGNGGTETVLTKVLNHYAGIHDLTLTLSSNPTNRTWLAGIDSRVKIHVAPSDHGIKKNLFFVKTFMNTKKDENLIMIGANMIKVAAMVRKAFHKKYRIISWIHFSLFDQDMFDPKNILYADYHLAIASKIKDQFMQLGIEESKIKLIYNPIEHNPIRKTDELKNEIAYIGRPQLQQQKNLKELLDGIALVDQTKLAIIGADKDEQTVKNYIKEQNLTGRVDWYGWKKDPWAIVEPHISAIVLTSKFEGLPMVFLEAISRGIPVISAQFAGYDDVVREGINGLSYPMGDVHKLAEQITKIQSIAQDPQKVADSVKPFYIENYFKHLDEVFSEILI